jgi:formylmethanofuran dehydrogenase subunit A
MFGQTVTESGDSMRQYAGSAHAKPNKWVVMDIECDNGCGVVPFRYRDKSYVHALQWAIGLETFLLVDDPWRVFLTTDHPNGGPFVTYPHLIKLLMDKSFRNDMFATINKDAAAMSTLASIDREYTLYEIAIMTRAAPAKSLGLHDCGHLGAGARADITVYHEHEDKQKMFEKPEYVFKNGDLVARNGKIVKIVNGGTHVVRPEFDASVEDRVRDHFKRFGTVQVDNFKISDDEIRDHGRGSLMTHPCRARSTL